MSYRLPDNIGYIIQIMGTAWNIKCTISKIKENKKKEEEKYVAQQRVYLIKKEGIFKSFAKKKRVLSLFCIPGLNELKNISSTGRYVKKFNF